VELERVTLEEWDDLLPSDGFEPFHLSAALAVLDRHATGDLRLYCLFNGDRPTALCPVFVRDSPLGRVVTSPPPSLLVPRLGPLLMPASPKPRKRERLNGEFVDALDAELDLDDPRTLCRLRCPPAYDDPRPFQWNGRAVTPTFTYRIGLDTTVEELERGFSRSLRRDIDTATEAGVVVESRPLDDADLVYDDAAARYAAQDEPFVDRAYVRDAVDALADRCRVYVATRAGERLGGLVVLYSDDAAYFWLGGVKPENGPDGVNACLHRRVAADVVEGTAPVDVDWYDLVGANTERLCAYKSKFAGELVPYYTVESSGLAMTVAKRAYGLVNRLR
jgi:hypothetical protein